MYCLFVRFSPYSECLLVVVQGRVGPVSYYQSISLSIIQNQMIAKMNELCFALRIVCYAVSEILGVELTSLSLFSFLS